MDIFKRTDGRSPYWFCDYVDPVNGKRKRVSLKVKGTRSEAMKAAATLLSGRQQTALEARDGKPAITLADALDAYCGALEADGKASAGECRKLAVKALGGLKDRFGLDPAMMLHEVAPATTKAIVKARRQEGNAAQTIAHELKLLRATMRHCAHEFRVNRDMLDGSVKNAWSMPKLKLKTRYLTLDEFQRVYQHMDPSRTQREGTLPYRQCQQARDLLVALAMTGGRWGEVRSLRWDRVHLDKALVRIWAGKTQDERIVGLPAMALEALTRRRRETNGDLVFPSTAVAGAQKTCRAIAKAFDACGLNEPHLVAEAGRATIHSLRHTFASLTLQGGASLAEVQQSLGHASLTMTRRYAHLEKPETANKLAQIMTSTLGPLGSP